MNLKNYIQLTGGLNLITEPWAQVCGMRAVYGESSAEGGFPAVGNWRTRRVRTSEAIRTHFFCAIRAFTKLELMRAEDEIENWYEVQRTLYLKVAREFILEHLKQKIGLKAHNQLSVNA